jgi:hypothetical protein
VHHPLLEFDELDMQEREFLLVFLPFQLTFASKVVILMGHRFTRHFHRLWHSHEKLPENDTIVGTLLLSAIADGVTANQLVKGITGHSPGPRAQTDQHSISSKARG